MGKQRYNVFETAPKKNCIVCGITFYNLRKSNYGWIRKWTKIQWLKAKFCSHLCRYKYLIGKPTGRAGTGKRFQKRNCIICNKEFMRSSRNDKQWDQAKTCSVDCYHKSRIGVKRPDMVGKIVKIRKLHKGKNHWNWKGGITSQNRLIRHSEKYNIWRKSIYKRDYWTCQRCLIKQKHPIAHHIKDFKKYPKLRFVITNGITLCRSCHKKVHKEIGLKTRFNKRGI